jgi:hypothetical protein
MKATISCDHRVVDGAVGAKWLKAFKSYLEVSSRALVFLLVLAEKLRADLSLPHPPTVASLIHALILLPLSPFCVPTPSLSRKWKNALDVRSFDSAEQMERERGRAGSAKGCPTWAVWK